LLRALRVAVTLVLLVLLWRAVDGPAALRRIAQAEWSWLLLAFAVLNLQTILSALRWKLTAGQLGMVFGARVAIREYYLGQVVNQVLPGGVLGDAGRAWRARAQAGLLAAGQAVVIERMAGQVALFATLAAGFVLTVLVPGGLAWPRWLALPMAGILIAGAAVPLAILAVARVGGPAGQAARRVCGLVRRALLDRSVLPRQIGLSLGTVACTLAAFACCARSVGVDLPFAVVVTLVPLVLLTMLVPLSVSGWGLREGAAAALLPLAGVPASAALAGSVVFGLVAIAAAIPGVFCLRPDPQAVAMK
jgi:uncharacterized membrane protein YbhN (UPF0104 family)